MTVFCKSSDHLQILSSSGHSGTNDPLLHKLFSWEIRTNNYSIQMTNRNNDTTDLVKQPNFWTYLWIRDDGLFPGVWMTPSHLHHWKVSLQHRERVSLQLTFNPSPYTLALHLLIPCGQMQLRHRYIHLERTLLDGVSRISREDLTTLPITIT